jgi:hypothetical protein
MIFYALFKTDYDGNNFFLGVFSSQEAVDKVIADVKQELIDDGFPIVARDTEFQAFACKVDEAKERSLRY